MHNQFCGYRETCPNTKGSGWRSTPAGSLPVRYLALEVGVLLLCPCLTAGVCSGLANPVAGQETPPLGPPPKAEAAATQNAAPAGTTPPPETKQKENSDNTDLEHGRRRSL